jgi:branched-chain amino acid transport system permease protein
VGIAFVAVVMYAPTGLTGLVMMHQMIWRHGSLKGLLKPYALCLLPALVAGIGAIGLLEHTHALSSGEDELTLWGIEFHVGAVSTWLIFAALLVVGFWLARKAAPAVANAYDAALKQSYKNVMGES